MTKRPCSPTEFTKLAEGLALSKLGADADPGRGARFAALVDPQTEADLRELAELIIADAIAALVDPQTEADLRELAELIIADAIAELLESDALDVEAEVEAMFAETACAVQRIEPSSSSKRDR